MAQTTEPKGNFIVGQNRAKKAGTNTPDFTGRIQVPGREHQNPIAVWIGRDKNGQLYFSGVMNPTPLTTDVMAQLESMTDRPVFDAMDVAQAGPNLTLKPHQFLAFKSKFKTPDPADTPEEAAKRAKRPDFWARVNPADGSPVFQVCASARSADPPSARNRQPQVRSAASGNALKCRRSAR